MKRTIMEELKAIWMKLIVWIENKSGIMSDILIVLAVMIILDQISGVLAANKEGKEHPDDPAYGITSSRMREGVYKKTGYLFTIAVAVVSDYLIVTLTNYMGMEMERTLHLGLLVTIWFVLTELLSIIENIRRLGVKVPDFLKKVLDGMKEKIEEEK